MRRQRTAAGATLAALWLGAPPAVAAEPEVVLVTASRVPESALTLPLSWSRVDERALDLVAPVHINEIMQRVPGAWISRGNGQESLIALRSPVLTGAGACGAFFTAMDGIALRAPGFCNVNQLFDANVEQAGGIEVIRGPATALYGSGAMHGVINVLSAPPTGELDHALSLEAGSWDYYRAKYHFRETFGAHGLSLNANGTTDGGYQDESGFDQQKVTLRHDYQGARWDVRSVFDASNLNQETAGFITGFKAFKDSAVKDTNPNPEAYRDAWSLLAYSRASLALDDTTSVVLTPYIRANDMEFLQHFLAWQPVEENGHESLGLRAELHGQGAGLSWLGGIDLDYTQGDLREDQEDDFSPNQPAGVHYDYRVDASTAAAFGQLRTNGSGPWELLAGLRLERTTYDYDNRTADGPACGPEADNCRFFRPADGEDEFNNWSVNLGASYALADTHVVYLRLARGFRAPETTELYRLQSDQASADLDSERVDNVEIGLRGATGGGTRYDLSLFYMEKDDVIFQDANRFNVSGAATRHYGVEFSLDLRLAERWTLGVDGTLASHTYDSRSELLGVSGDIHGNDIDTAPRALGSARLEWDLSGLAGRATRAELEWVYMENYYLEPENLHEYDGHSLLNLRLGSALSRRWSAALRVTNLLDEDYAERADFGFGSYRYFVGQPRAGFVEISYRIGI